MFRVHKTLSVEQNAERYAESELPFFMGVLRTPILGALPFFMGRAPIFHRQTPMGSRGVPETRAAGGHWQFYWVSDAWALGEGAMRMELANATWKSPMDSRRVPGIYMVRRFFPLSWCLVHSASAFFLHPLQAVAIPYNSI